MNYIQYLTSFQSTQHHRIHASTLIPHHRTRARPRTRTRTHRARASRRRRQRNKALSMSRLGLPLSSILRVITQTNLSPRNIPPINGPIKELQTSNRLIIRHLMTSLIDPGEREVPILPALAVLDPINDHRDVPCVPELLGVRVLDGLGHRFPAKPVADVVCVAVDEGDADRQ